MKITAMKSKPRPKSHHLFQKLDSKKTRLQFYLIPDLIDNLPPSQKPNCFLGISLRLSFHFDAKSIRGPIRIFKNSPNLSIQMFEMNKTK